MSEQEKALIIMFGLLCLLIAGISGVVFFLLKWITK